MSNVNKNRVLSSERPSRPHLSYNFFKSSQKDSKEVLNPLRVTVCVSLKNNCHDCPNEALDDGVEFVNDLIYIFEDMATCYIKNDCAYIFQM